MSSANINRNLAGYAVHYRNLAKKLKQSQTDAKQERIAPLQTRLAEMKKKTDDLFNLYKTEVASVNRLQSEEKACQLEINMLRTEMHRLSEFKTKLGKRTTKLIEEKTELEKKSMDIYSATESLRDEIDCLNTKILKIKGEKEEFRTTLEAAIQEDAEAMTDLSDVVLSINDQIENTRRDGRSYGFRLFKMITNSMCENVDWTNAEQVERAGNTEGHVHDGDKV